MQFLENEITSICNLSFICWGNVCNHSLQMLTQISCAKGLEQVITEVIMCYWC